MSASAFESPFLRRIRAMEKALAAGLPGEEFQMHMAPSLRPRPSQFNPNATQFHNAGVLMGLVPDFEDNERVAVVLIERAHGPDVHAGQVAFPGGKQEAGESLIATAVRETEEEIGIPTSDWIPLGALSPLFIPPSRFHVHPFLFYLHSMPEFRLSKNEVRQVLVVPLSHFLATHSKGLGEFNSSGGMVVEAPFYQWNELRIWGATAMMLSELCALTIRAGL